MIKVKLPPKELAPEENPFAQQQNWPRQTPDGAAHAPQREPSAPPSARLPKRPVRLTTQEPATGKELSGKINASTSATRISGKLGNVSDTPALPASFARPETALPKTSAAEEDSTMVLAGWREELERVRKEQASASSVTEAPSLKPATTAETTPARPSPDNSPVKPVRPSSVASEDKLAWPQPPQNRRAETLEKPADPKNPQKKYSVEPEQGTGREQSPSTEQPRRELHVKVWEQEPTMQFPQVSVSKEKPGPAPAVEHTPFANIAFDTEKQAEQIAQVETIHWEALPQTPAPPAKSQEPATRVEPTRWETLPQTPAPTPKSQDFSAPAEPVHWELPPQTPTPDPDKTIVRPPKEHRPLQTEEKQPLSEKKQPGEDDIEDQPTAHLAVPESVQIKPGVTVERTSTPAPTTWATQVDEEVEDQPTRPIPASVLASRSPVPPTTPQRDQLQSRPGVPAPAANPTSLSGLSAGPTQTSTAFGAEGTRGQTANSHAPAFDPASLPPLPLNSPAQTGTSQPGFGTQNAPQRSRDEITQRPAPFAQAGSSWPGTSSTTKAEESKPSKKKRGSGKMVIITLVVLVILGAGGGLWYYQSSSGGAQPYQSFKNTGLGVTLSYPQGWKVTVNQAQTSAHFADSNQTDQVTLSTIAPGTQQMSQYLAQESTQLGITGTPKTTSLTFGGTTWQEVQSTVVQQGVTYKLTLYITAHNNRFYALIVQAPPTTYAQIEQEDFQPLRSSFAFL